MIPIGPAGTGPRLPRAWAALAAAGLAAVLWGVYSVAFDAPFYFDTVVHLVDRSNLQVVSLSPQALWDAMHWDFGGRIDRPLSRLSLALTHYFFGLEPRPYRVGNLLIHAASAGALYFMLLAVLRSPRVGRTSPFLASRAAPVAACAAVLWALHPVQTNVVTYVIQRMASLCGLFTFLCVGCYLRGRAEEGGRRRAWFAGSAAALLLAAAAKESGVLALPLALLAEVSLLDRPARFPARRAAWCVAGVAALGIAALLLWNPKTLAGYLSYGNRSFDMAERLWTQARLQFEYLRVLLVPVPGNLRFVYEPEVSRGWLAPPSTLAAVLALAAAAAAALWLRRRRPLLGFGVLWFLTAQAMESTILPLELYYEHRMAVPSAALALGASALLWEACRRLRSRRAALWSWLAVAVLVAGEASATLERNRTWADPVAFWTDALEKQPDSARVLSYLGSEFTARNRYAEAEEAYRRALELNPGKSHLYHVGLARAAYAQGRREEAREYLLLSWEKVRRTNGGAARQLGMLALQDRDLAQARRYLELALKESPADAEAWRLLGVTRMLAEEPDGAEEALQKALRFRPRDPETWNTLGALAFQRRDYAEAEARFRSAASLAPGNQGYLDNLARAAAARAAP